MSVPIYHTLLRAQIVAVAMILIGFAQQPAWSEKSLYATSAENHSRSLCLRAALELEARHHIPRGLLYALALTESGRWDKKTASSYAWPWTVRNGPDGYVVDNLGEAVDLVEGLRARGKRNIDIGCMQVNLHYHPDAFETPGAGFDPLINMSYAADFLVRLRNQHRSWAQAIERYHSSDPIRSRYYRKKVYKHWNKVRRDVAGVGPQPLSAPSLVRPAAPSREQSRLRLFGASNSDNMPVLLK